MSDRHALSLEQAAVLLGGYRSVEHHLFELTGRWSAEAPWPEVQVHLFEMSLQHGWHAELFAERLPRLAHIDPEALTLAPAAATAVLARLEKTEDLLPALAGFYRVVLPRTLAGYERHRGAAVPHVDGPTIRALDLVMRDEMAQWRRGECLVQSIINREDQAHEIAVLVGELESLIVQTKPQMGWGWPDDDTGDSNGV